MTQVYKKCLGKTFFGSRFPTRRVAIPDQTPSEADDAIWQVTFMFKGRPLVLWCNDEAEAMAVRPKGWPVGVEPTAENRVVRRLS